MTNSAQPFLALEHLNRIRDTIMFIVKCNLVKKLEDFARKVKAKTWKHIGSQKYNSRGDALFLKHSEELKENGNQNYT